MTVIHQQRPDPRTNLCGSADHRFGVIVTSQIRSPYLRVDTTLAYDYPVIILREGARYGVADSLLAALTPAQAHPWRCAWGIPDGADIWDYVDPDALIRPEDIRPAHRMPQRVLEQLSPLL